MFDSPLRRAAALGGQRSGEAAGPSLYETPSSRARASAGSSLGRECEHPISHSTAEAEYISASMAAREAIFIIELVKDFDAHTAAPVPMHLDSKSAIDMAFDPVAFKKTKHILRDAEYLRDLVAREKLKPTFVASAEQLADIFTKPLYRATFMALRARLDSATNI